MDLKNRPEPMFEVAEFGSFELFSPCVDETVWFFRDLLGMIETERDGSSVYLRGFDDPYKHTLKITECDQAGMGFAGWRAMSAQALDRRVAAIKESGRGIGWVEGECGVGPAYEFTTPDGAIQRLNWEVEYYRPPVDQKSVLLNRVQRRPLHGVPIKKIDHLNLLAKNVTENKDFVRDVLGFKLSENIVFDDNVEAGAWLRLQTRSHDLAFTKDRTGEGGRLHHVAFLLGNTQHLQDACDVLTDHGLELEAGPAHHGISQAEFLYVFEPGGNRIELVGQLGYDVHDPSFEPITWRQNTLDNAIIWYGSPLPEEFDTYGTPNHGPTRYRTPNRYIQAEAQLLHGKP
jgi:catechol 2,3-dioxygenase